MSSSVWFEEVNIGFLNELKNSIRIRDELRNLVQLPDNAFVVRKPEEDFKIETFPCVSIYPLSYKHTPIRYFPYPVQTGYNIDKGSIGLEDHAISFDLSYQVDFWSRYQEDLDYMTRTWLSGHFRQFNLKVTDDGGNERTCNVIADGSIFRSDLVQAEQRIFHAILKYTIWVEIDEENGYNVPMIRDINIKTEVK